MSIEVEHSQNFSEFPEFTQFPKASNLFSSFHWLTDDLLSAGGLSDLFFSVSDEHPIIKISSKKQ